AKQCSCLEVPKLQIFPQGAGRQAPVVVECHRDRMELVSGQAVKELTVLPVPDLLNSVSCGRELSAVGTERNGISRPKLASGVARLSQHRLVGRRQVPDLDSQVRAAGGQVLAVGVECDADDRIGVRLEGLYHPTRPAVPDLDGPVSARGGEELAV